jgi:hypothetical protein
METITVTLIPDEDGHVGRECPDCHRYFKVRPGTGVQDQTEAYCPYCGQPHDPGDFLTRDQLNYAKSVALGQIEEELLGSLRDIPRTAGPVSISITVEGDDVPIEHYQERTLETSVTCERCTLEYKIYGVFATCPDCNTHNSQAIIRANLALLRLQLPDADEARLADILANTVASFDAFGRAATEHELGTKISVQNLDLAEAHLQSHGRSLRVHTTGEEWEFLTTSFQKRHVLVHNMGVADEPYLARAHDPDAILGRKVRISKSEVERTMDLLERLADNLTRTTPAPAPLPMRPPRPKNPYQLSTHALQLAILLHEKDDCGLPTAAITEEEAQDALGLDDLHFDAALRELSDYRLVEREHRWLKATPYLPVALVDTIDYSPTEDDRTLAEALVDATKELGGDELVNHTGLDARRLNHAVRRLEDKGAVEVSKAFGTAPYAFRTVRATGATLRYLRA